MLYRTCNREIAVQPESEKGINMYNYSKVKIGIIYLLLNLFLFSNISFSQENVLRLAWTPNKETYLSHYIVYRDTEPGTMKKLHNIAKPDSTYSDATVEPGVTSGKNNSRISQT